MFERLVRAMHAASSPGEVLELYLNAMLQSYGASAYIEVVIDGAGQGEYRVARLRHEDGVEAITPMRAPFDASGLDGVRGGLLGSVIGGDHRAQIRSAISVTADDPLGADLARYRSLAAIPIYTAGQPEWVVLLNSEPDHFRDLPLDDLMLRGNLVGAILESMKVACRLREAQARIQEEVDRIAEIQRALLPASAPEVPGLEVAFEVTSFDRAGGDLVDFGEPGADEWGFIVADASGHGPSAAVVAAMLTAIVRVLPEGADQDEEHGIRAVDSVEAAMEFANRHLCQKRIERSFVTACLGTWSHATRTMRLARAGHPLPMLRRASGEVVEFTEGGGIPLGIFADAKYPATTHVLSPGDLLLFYSDGILEAASPAGELFGTDRLAVALGPASSPGDALDRVRRAVEAFTANAAPSDDRSMLVLKVK